MAPLKTSLARSAAKLFGVFNTQDLSLRGVTGSSRQQIEPSPATSSGGTLLEPGNDYRYHVFISTVSENLEIDCGTQNVTMDVMAIGGGGGAAGGSTSGGGTGGGGGGGGMVYRSGVSIPKGVTHTLPVTCGAGGAGQPPSAGYGSDGTNGDDTTFGAAPQPLYLIAKGGGGGVAYNPDGEGGKQGKAGGSGGGAAQEVGGVTSVATQPTQAGNSGTFGYGNAGGSSTDDFNTGGGGGAGGAGGNGVPGDSGNAGDGGAGRPIPEFAAPIIAPAIPVGAVRTAWTSAVGPTGLYAGGGGGGSYNDTAGGPGPGGGGAGITWSDDNDGSGTDGVEYTGGGGGGGIGGGDGGNGIVIVRFPAPVFVT